MAIRIGPPPVSARLRVRCYATHDFYLTYWRGIGRALARTAARVSRWSRTVTASLSSYATRHPPAMARRQAKYACFVDRYEELVEVLCWAAKDGDHTDRDAQYGRVRQWMQLNYHRFRPHLRAHLGTWAGPFDPFEELFAPECIDEVIHDGNAIANFICTRSAVEAYRAVIDTTQTNH